MDLQMSVYRCVPTNIEGGLIEVVPNAVTLADIQKKAGGARGAFRQDALASWLRLQCTDRTTLVAAFVFGAKAALY